MQWSNLLLVEGVWARERFKSMLQAEEDVKFTISDLSLDVMFWQVRYWKAETKALVKVHMHEILQRPLLAISTSD